MPVFALLCTLVLFIGGVVAQLVELPVLGEKVAGSNLFQMKGFVSSCVICPASCVFSLMLSAPVSPALNPSHPRCSSLAMFTWT